MNAGRPASTTPGTAKGNGSPAPRSRWIRRLARVALLVLVVVALGVGLTLVTLRLTDRQIREDLLTHAQLIARCVSTEDLRTLTGRPEDESLPGYARLKARMASVRAADPSLRFLYLVGQSPSRALFFYVDSDPAGSPDEAPPSILYPEAPEELKDVFSLGRMASAGPYTDRWGTLVSAFVPVTDPDTGTTLAVLGLDVDARQWRWEQILRSAQPLLLTIIILLLCILYVAQTVSKRRIRAARKALERRADFERLISTMLSHLSDTGEGALDVRINEGLARLGQFTGSDRAYVFLLQEDGMTADNTHEWCAPGVQPQMEQLKGVNARFDLPWFMAAMTRLEMVHVPRMADMPEEAIQEREHFQQQGITSIIVAPIAQGQHLTGWIGFDSVGKEAAWDEDAKALLRLVADVLAAALGRQRVEQETRRERTFLHNILVQIPLPVFILDKKGVCVMVNRMFQSFHQVADPSRVVGRSVLVEPLSRETGVADYLPRALAGDTVETPAVACPTPLGDGMRQVKTRLFPVYNRQGELTHVVAMQEDMTRQVEAAREQERRQQKQAEMARLESLARLAGGIAHKMNNHLTTILGNTGLVLAEAKLSTELAQSLRDVELAATAASTLANQTLLFSGQAAFSLEPLDLHSLVASLKERIRALLPLRAQVLYHLEECPPVKGDRARLADALCTLVQNAAESMAETGGIITVSTGLMRWERTDVPTVRIAGELEAGTYGFIQVEDPGRGLTPEVIDQVFDPLSAATFTGRGFGLATVQGIVRGHGGGFCLSPEAGAGAQATMLLPLALPAMTHR